MTIITKTGYVYKTNTNILFTSINTIEFLSGESRIATTIKCIDIKRIEP